MPVHVSYIRGRETVVGFSEAESGRELRTENVYTVILMGRGSLALRANGQTVRGRAPCVWALRENLDVEFISSRGLAARSLYFNMPFLYRSATLETVNSGKYEKLAERLDLVPLDIFHGLSGVCVLPLSDAAYDQADGFFTHFYGSISDRGDERWSCRARCSLNELLELADRVRLDYTGPDQTGLGMKDPRVWVQTMLNIIHTEYGDKAKLSLAPLAGEIHVNKDTVAKKFREIAGCSVGEYILDYRIRCACLTLSNTNLTVKEIAKNCGFGAEAYFIRQFEKRKGMTPTVYRRRELEMRKREFAE